MLLGAQLHLFNKPLTASNTQAVLQKFSATLAQQISAGKSSIDLNLLQTLKNNIDEFIAVLPQQSDNTLVTALDKGILGLLPCPEYWVRSIFGLKP